ncbi:tetrahydromethanopterin S-methyltransferase subunit H [Methanolapillus ohkumae]|uniref:Methylcorrinoid:tetrahydrofolate methyltransferase n=1 Tax=Methanolapillus ohkumae TaxID=3028298 RepID=A0AA96VJV9_9EURY|nr:Methylcorrinoid:tetrahydrofolate methyltransferase [Methanosarcinaceae archaeon Am2]
MFKFDKSQEIYEIGGVRFGGQPGEVPTVIIGTMFYNRHKIVTHAEAGLFDKAAAEKLWNDQVEICDQTGVACANQLVGETPEAIKNYIDWFVEIEDKAPFLMDSSDGEVRAFAARYATEIGICDRAIYNSVNASIEEKEIQALAESDIESAIILAFNAVNPTVLGKVEILEKGGAGLKGGLLQISKNCGISKPLIDIAAVPLGSGAGASMRGITAIKGHLGYPAGGGFHNTASAWDWIRDFKKTKENPKEYYLPADVGTNLVAQTLGADFLLYGPIENAKYVAPSVAMVDILLEENAKDLGIKLTDEEKLPIGKLI